MRSVQARRHQAAMVSGAAAFFFFTLVWYFAARQSLATAFGLGVFMGLVVLTSSWRIPPRGRL
jgi:hypothetical protein